MGQESVEEPDDATSRHGSSEPSEDGPLTVTDDDLPEDLRPTEDNPLARPADDDVPDDLLTQDRGHAGSSGGSGDADASGDDGGSDSS